MLDPKNVHIGCSPISWMSDDEPELAGDITWQQTASEIALGGYEGLELGSAYPMDAEVLKYELDLRGLKLANAWFSMRFTQRPMQETIDRFKQHLAFMSAMGAPVIGAGECGVTIHLSGDVPLYPAPPVLSDAQFEALAKGLEECGRLTNEKGVKFGIHPHMGTGVQTAADIARIMEMTDPKLVHLILDAGHTAAAGEDPCALLETYIDRIPLVHVKDGRKAVMQRVKDENMSFLKGVTAGMFTTPGDGDAVDWDTFFGILDKHDFKGWIVVEAEQDPSKAHPLTYTMNARKFIREKLGF